MLRCLTLTADSDTDKLRNIRNNSQWLDAIEIRLDLCLQRNKGFITSLVDTACEASLSVVILSFRREEDGGKKTELSEAERLNLLEQLLCPGITHVDIERGVTAPGVEARADELGIEVIRSLHDFQGVPASMTELIEEIAAVGEIPKIACYPSSSQDVLELIRIARETFRIKNKIVLGMGAFGFFSRVAPQLCGSMLTFCSAGERSGAPGQTSPRELEEVYRVSQQNSHTVYFGIIGNPVLHSKSPQLHNPWFAEGRMNAIYVPFQVDDVGLFMRLAEQLGIRGFSVTVPHKQKIIQQVDRVEEAVQSIGSCNTVIRTSEGWVGSNTDYQGFLAPLKRTDILSVGNHVLVIGAGGVARTVVYALVQAGLVVTIVNRTDEKAAGLAAEFGVNWKPMQSQLSAGKFELIVQTTSAGMEPNTEIDPLPGYKFKGSEIVYELIYAPEQTRFLSRAGDAGCRIIGGREMLHAQALLQFEQFSSAYNPEAE
ncbi:MAG: shikimate dehydrogenase [Spirochaetaceae bacterium]|nr:shikimate dehydrogenase [Spirochaetaceae bacterium]MCF7947470.1 shikimate dehydrogenase [Spirochaetia bacterium]MCF7950576.1 shikimate dehydrogenase [Spirochaetaceae bacterium]